MKNVLLMSLASIIIPFTLSASELIPGSTLKVSSTDGQTDISAIKASLSVVCKYKSGIIFPENKSCGSKSFELKVSSDGSISIPAVEKFGNLHGSSLSNYDVSVGISEGKNYLATLASYGKEGIKKFNFDGQTLTIYKFNAAKIKVAVDGQDFFGSEMSKKDRAMLFLSINSTAQKRTINEVLISSSLSGTPYFAENFKRSTSLQLENEKEISVKPLIYASFEKSEQLKVSVYYDVSNTVNQSYSGIVQVDLTPSALESIGTISIYKNQK